MDSLITNFNALKKSTQTTADLAIEYNQKVGEFKALLDAFCKPEVKSCSEK